ncbi:DUF4302 domain-containing protein [Sphingobacterium sp. LRF_L2]|uniref:DUF4302 domain-containing protein n=1 Tax=Sphingobacterium sp. LRF_L2 TaxID=3369421 RepID=UPI003F640BB2
MMKYFYSVLWLFLLLSCEKDTITRSVSEAEARQEQLIEDLKTALQSAENGWVMMVKSSLSEKIYTPVVMKFDTVKNKVDIVTVYGLTDTVDTYFNINTGTSYPLLTFTTGSIITSLYRLGAQASDLTDHIFKVLSVSADSIQLQCYRGGSIYSAEGGTSYTLFRRPEDWKWADNDRYFNLDNTSEWTSTFLNSSKRVTLSILDPQGVEQTKSMIYNNSITTTSLTTFRRSDPFAKDASAQGFLPFYLFWMYFYKSNTGYQTAVTIGHNALSFYPFTVTQNVSTSTNVRSLIEYFGTYYFVAKEVTKNGSQLTVEFVAYGSQGQELLSTSYILN